MSFQRSLLKLNNTSKISSINLIAPKEKDLKIIFPTISQLTLITSDPSFKFSICLPSLTSLQNIV